MFQFPGFASIARYHVFYMVGCPIRKFSDRKLFALPRDLSQLITSFFACESLGIPHTPFSTFFNLFLIALTIMSKNFIEVIEITFNELKSKDSNLYLNSVEFKRPSFQISEKIF